MSPRSVCDRLRDVLTAIDRAAAFGTAPRGEMATAAALYELIVIGEAVGALPADVLDAQSRVPKGAVVGMRNLAAHEYHRVNADYVWGTVDDDLPVLRATVAEELARLEC